MEEAPRLMCLPEVQYKLKDKEYWLQACIDKMPSLTEIERIYMWNHLSILRSHIEILKQMEKHVKRGVPVMSDRIYWE